MGGILNEWALSVVPGLILLWATNQRKGWFGAPKTRRINTEEHAANALRLDEAIKYSRSASEGVAHLDGRLSTYIAEHQKVHDRIP